MSSSSESENFSNISEIINSSYIDISSNGFSEDIVTFSYFDIFIPSELVDIKGEEPVDLFTDYKFPHYNASNFLENGESNVLYEILQRDVQKSDCKNCYRRIYDYLMYHTVSTHKMKENIEISFSDIKNLALLNIDILTNRFTEIIAVATKRIHKNSPLFSPRDYEHCKVSDKLCLYNLNNARIFSMGVEKNISSNKPTLSYSNIVSKDELEVNPIVFFNFIDEHEVKELSLIYQIVSSSWIYSAKAFSSEILQYNFCLQHQKFVNIITEYALYRSKQGIGSKIKSFGFLNYKTAANVLDIIEMYTTGSLCDNKSFTFPDIDVISHFESQFSVFILLIVFGLKYETAATIIYSLYSERNIPFLSSSINYSKKQIQEIFRKVKFSTLDTNKINQSSCPICLKEYSINSEVMTLACEHIFHFRCISRWLLKSHICPFCKQKAQSVANLRRSDEIVNIYSKNS